VTSSPLGKSSPARGGPDRSNPPMTRVIQVGWLDEEWSACRVLPLDEGALGEGEVGNPWLTVGFTAPQSSASQDIRAAYSCAL
jgi:hypothetical protein